MQTQVLSTIPLIQDIFNLLKELDSKEHIENEPGKFLISRRQYLLLDYGPLIIMDKIGEATRKKYGWTKLQYAAQIRKAVKYLATSNWAFTELMGGENWYGNVMSLITQNICPNEATCLPGCILHERYIINMNRFLLTDIKSIRPLDNDKTEIIFNMDSLQEDAHA